MIRKRAETDGGPSPQYFIESLARGLAVLSAFEPKRFELSLAEIAEIAGVTTPSALRIGYTLVSLGYLVRNPSTKGYRLGPRSLGLGMATLSSLSLLEIAEPYLRELRDTTTETVKMAVLDDTEVVYVARFPSHVHGTTMDHVVGTRLPAPLTSMGRAMLARMDDEEVRAIIGRSRLTALTARTVTDPKRILADIRRARDRGYAISDQGVTLQRRSVATALTDATGQAVGAVNIGGAVQRLSVAKLESDLAPPLRDTAAEISSVLPPGIVGFPMPDRD